MIITFIESHYGVLITAIGWASHVGLPKLYNYWAYIGGFNGFMNFIKNGKK